MYFEIKIIIPTQGKAANLNKLIRRMKIYNYETDRFRCIYNGLKIKSSENSVNLYF